MSLPLKLDHIGIAVRNLSEAISMYRDKIGLELLSVEEVKEENVRIAMFRIGDSRIELLEPLTADGAVARFLSKRGPGIHHIAFTYADARSASDRLREKGMKLVYSDVEVIPGLREVNFVHPESTGGVLLEIVKRLE
ncbi:MAG: methylmalonyl-CoA epimerase [Nitrososphaerota archaeon]|jgi:methylmalonyl-CoA epimerase|nr:methylmalonyl-CoA epimerase [Nitrososphaerota archaeon]